MLGGALSLVGSLFFFQLLDLESCMGPPAAGLIEEASKALMLLLVVRKLKYRWEMDQGRPFSGGADNRRGTARYMELRPRPAFYLKEIALGFVAWVVLLSLIQHGLREIRAMHAQLAPAKT